MQTLDNAAIAVRNKNAAYYGLTPRDYLALKRFSIAADNLGVKSNAISKGPLQGALLKLSSGNNNYEVLVDGAGQVLLGRVEADGKRVRLSAAGTNSEASWGKLIGALKASEGRA
jgi:hypothetical protein